MYAPKSADGPETSGQHILDGNPGVRGQSLLRTAHDLQLPHSKQLTKPKSRNFQRPLSDGVPSNSINLVFKTYK